MTDPAILAASPRLLTEPAAAAAAQLRNARPDAEATRRAAEEFEAVFLSQMLEHMFAGVTTDGPFGGGSAEETYRSMMLQEYGRLITRAGGIGLADQVMAEMLRMQEG